MNTKRKQNTKRYVVKLYHESAGICEWLELARFETEDEAFAWMFAQPRSSSMKVFFY